MDKKVRTFFQKIFFKAQNSKRNLKNPSHEKSNKTIFKKLLLLFFPYRYIHKRQIKTF